jgi:hypothetical protein
LSLIYVFTVYIFISHSQLDDKIKNFFSNAIVRTSGLNATLMEFEDLEGFYAGDEISNIIWHEATECVVVLLERNISNFPYTHNWVNFEVGVASGWWKPVWVFEEYGRNIHFPISFVTDYCRYRLNDSKFLRYIGEILVFSLAYLMTYGVPVVRNEKLCPNCSSKFNYWNDDKIRYCPVCRQPLNYRGRKVNLRLSNI